MYVVDEHLNNILLLINIHGCHKVGKTKKKKTNVRKNGGFQKKVRKFNINMLVLKKLLFADVIFLIILLSQIFFFPGSN